VLLRLQGKRVHVDTHRRDVGVVLVRLDLIEVATLANREPIVTVELDERGDNRVTTGHTLNAGDRVARLEDRAVPPVREVEWLLALPGESDQGVAGHEAVALDNPHKLLTRVVEVELELVGGGGDGLTTSELQHVNEVLVGYLGELTTLISIQVDVVDVQRGSHQVSSGNAVTDYIHVGVLGSKVKAEVADIVEGQVDTNLVVLERNEWQCQTRVAAEPELQRHVQSVLRGAVLYLVGRVRLARHAVIIASLTTLYQQIGQLGHVTNHLGITGLLTRLLGELVPDVEPLTIVLVNALTTNLELNLLDEVVANPVEPAELGTRTVGGEELHLGQSGLEVHTVNQVTVTLDGNSHLLAKARGTVERVLNGLHGEVSVAAVHHLEEGNLRITSQVNILSTISYELHKTPACHISLYL
jgi:hypothetical protein